MRSFAAVLVVAAMGCGFGAPAASPTDAEVDAAIDAPDAPPAMTWISLAQWISGTCGVRSDHSLWCWGDSTYGQVGIPGVESAAVPMRVDDASWDRVATGLGTSCGIRTDGTLWCWGGNFAGEAGVTPGNIAMPTQFGTALWNDVAVGWGHACGIDRDGHVWCWGDNTIGELGLGTTDGEHAPPHLDAAAVTGLGDATFTHVAVGYGSTCALATTGELWCWGNNSNGQLGIGSDQRSFNVPTMVTGHWRTVALSYVTTCALDDAGAPSCWGFGKVGTTGDPSLMDHDVPVPVAVPLTTPWTDISVGWYHACASGADGALWCWGYNNPHGEVANAMLGPEKVATPQVLDVGAPVTGLAHPIGAWGTCAFDDTGGARCTGYDGQGALGSGTGGPRLAPVHIPGAWTQVSVGNVTTCGTHTDGTFACWGQNDYRQIAPDAFPADVPRDIGRTGSQIVAGTLDVCEITALGAVQCVGYNGSHRVASDNDGFHDAPVIAATVVAATLSARKHACAIPPAPMSGAYCWGENDNGELGIGNADGQAVPQHPFQQWTLTSVAVGNDFTCLTNNLNAAYCLGANGSGQLGTGTTDPHYDAQFVPGIWSRVFAGGSHACGIDTSNHLQCWGANAVGQVGVDATSEAVLSPTLVGPTSVEWRTVGLGLTHSCAITVGGELYCWGSNSHGELGLGTRTPQSTPTRVGTRTDWRRVSAGDSTTCALAGDELWCWGFNNYGQVGDDSAWRFTFAPVLAPN